MQKRSLGSTNTDFYPSKPMHRRSTGTALTSRNTIGPSAHRATISSSLGRAPNLKPHETALFQAAPDIIMQFLINTRYSGAVSNNLSSKTLRLKEFHSILTHIMRHILPDFTLTSLWEGDVEQILRAFGYPFAVPSKSSLASFEITETPRRCALIMMAWLIRFIHYFNARFGFEGITSLDHVRALTASGASETPGYIVPVETLYRMSLETYIEWLRSPGQSSFIPSQLLEHYQEHLQHQQQVNEQLVLEHNTYEESLRSFRHATEEIQHFDHFKAQLLQNIDEEQKKIRQIRAQHTKIKSKTQEKLELQKSLSLQITDARTLIDTIKMTISQQVETEADVIHLNRSRMALQTNVTQVKQQTEKAIEEALSYESTLGHNFEELRARIRSFNGLTHEINTLEPFKNDNSISAQDFKDDNYYSSQSRYPATPSRDTPYTPLAPLLQLSPGDFHSLTYILSTGETDREIIFSQLADHHTDDDYSATPGSMKQNDLDGLISLAQRLKSGKIYSETQSLRKRLAARLDTLTHSLSTLQYDLAVVEKELSDLKEAVSWLVQKKADLSTRSLDQQKQHIHTIAAIEQEIADAHQEVESLQRSHQKLQVIQEREQKLRATVDHTRETQARERSVILQRVNRFADLITHHIDSVHNNIADLHLRAKSISRIITNSTPVPMLKGNDTGEVQEAKLNQA